MSIAVKIFKFRIFIQLIREKKYENKRDFVLTYQHRHPTRD